MAQFDVYANPNMAYRKIYPWVIDIQHELLSALRTRLSVPLSLTSPEQHKSLPARLFVQLQFQSKHYTLMPHLASAVHISHLKKAQGNVRHYQSEIQGALDAVASGV